MITAQPKTTIQQIEAKIAHYTNWIAAAQTKIEYATESESAQYQKWIQESQSELETLNAQLQELQPQQPQTITRTLTPEELTARVEMLNATIESLEYAKFTKDSAGEYSLYIPEIEFSFFVEKTSRGWVYCSEEHTTEDTMDDESPLATKKEAIAECKDFAECFIGCLIERAPIDEFDFN